MKQVFSDIYKNNKWKSNESVSGPSSTLERTKKIRESLPQLFDKYKFKNIFDGPCGDFNWMQHVVINSPHISYIGGDIVDELIESNVSKYSNISNAHFIVIDIVTDKLPVADVMICRDCVFHLSYKDTKEFLVNFLSSEIEYLLTTTHINNGKFANKDINTGDWRWMDLFSAPYSFPSEFIERFSDGHDRFLIMWNKDQIRQAVINWMD